MARVFARLTGDNNNFTDFLQWAGNVPANTTTNTAFGFAYILGQLGFVLQSDIYTAQWANAMAIGAAALPTAAGSLSNNTTFGTSTNNSRAALAGSHFKNAWSGATTYAAGDVVTYTPGGGVASVYISTAAGNLNNVPITLSGGVYTIGTNWSPYYMEIWKTNSGTLTEIYIKFEYGGSATVSQPQFTAQVGTTYSANSGVIGGSTENPNVEEMSVGGGQGTGQDCYFAGDGKNYFICYLWRNTVAGNALLWGFERSISGTVAGAPVYNSDYVTTLALSSGVPSARQNAVFLSGTQATRQTYFNTLALGTSTNSLQVEGKTPMLPIFPLVGWCGNPLTIAVAFHKTDIVEGDHIKGTVYNGLSYVATKDTSGLAIGGFGSSPQALGIRFDPN